MGSVVFLGLRLDSSVYKGMVMTDVMLTLPELRELIDFVGSANTMLNAYELVSGLSSSKVDAVKAEGARLYEKLYKKEFNAL